MITFVLSLFLLLGGYFFYSKKIEKVFGADRNRVTPAFSMQDGVDYVPLPTWRIFLIQFLNIAGLGPIFGAVLGAVYGPIAFLWITLGCIFGGAVHDYFSGMLSIKHGGLSIPEIVGNYLGVEFKQFMRIFTVFLMILVGAVFIIGPAGILASLTPDYLSKTFWVWIVFAYYIVATLLPIDKLIGKVYPVFGLALLFMALGILLMMIVNNYSIPELVPDGFTNQKTNAEQFPVFPMLFVTIACGAISGFHSTQSPLMARCLKNEILGRKVFYGAMVAEGVVALIWAAIGMSFFGGVNELNSELTLHHNDASWAVKVISDSLLGKIGGILAILGVVAAPITSGDTAFRSARLIVSDFLNFKQIKIKNRLLISLPIFVLGFLLTQFKFDIIWRYMAWSNQTLATIVLWAITVYLIIEKKNYWITLIPAIFMTSVVCTYILVAPEGFRLSIDYGYPIGFAITILCTIIFFNFVRKKRKLSKL